MGEELAVVNQHDEHDHEEGHNKHSVHDESFLGSQSKAQFRVVIVGHLVRTDTKTFIWEPKFLVEDFREKIKHFKKNLMMLKQRVWIT